MQASTLDLLFVGFRGFAVAAGAAIVLAIGAHGGRRAPEPMKLASNVVPITPKRTLLAATRATVPAKLGDVDAFLLERVSREEGARVSWAEAFLSYRGWCDGSGCSPVDAKAFGARLDALRDELGLKVRTKGQDVFFVDLKLASMSRRLTCHTVERCGEIYSPISKRFTSPDKALPQDAQWQVSRCQSTQPSSRGRANALA